MYIYLCVYWSSLYTYNLNKNIFLLDYKKIIKIRTCRKIQYKNTDMNILSFDRSAIKSHPPFLLYLSSVRVHLRPLTSNLTENLW